MKNETGNLVENLRDNTIFKNTECKDNSNVQKFGGKNSVNWNHTNLIINYNQKYSDLIHVDPNHTNSNQPIPDNSTHIGSIHNSDDIFATDTVLTSPVHSTVQASRIFNYGNESDPPSPPNDSSSENVTPRLNT